MKPLVLKLESGQIALPWKVNFDGLFLEIGKRSHTNW